MQRICRDSLADCTASRRRRQMIRLKSIKRILEDLQKQIRSLRNASKEETPNRNTTIPSTTTTTPSASATSAPLPSTSSGPSTSGLDNPTAGPSTSAGKNCTYFFVKSIWLIESTKKIIIISCIWISASDTSAPVPSTSYGPSTSGLNNPIAGPSTSAGKNCTYFSWNQSNSYFNIILKSYVLIDIDWHIIIIIILW